MLQCSMALLLLLALAATQSQPDLCEQELNRIKDLLQVSCVGQGLSGVPVGLPKATGILLLGSNRLAHFSTAWLQHLPNLTDLDLSSNGLGGLEASAMLPRLQELVLSRNTLQSLPALRGMPNLRRLALDHNALAWLPEGGFHALEQLADLELQGNRLQGLPTGAFKGLAALKDLDLSDNLLQGLPARLLAGLGALETLRLERNQLRAMPDGFFPKGHFFAYVYLEGNPWHCDCSLNYLRAWLEENEFSVYTRTQGPGKEVTENEPESVTCWAPPEHAGLPVLHFRPACTEESTEGHPSPSTFPATPSLSSLAAATISPPGHPPTSVVMTPPPATPSSLPAATTSAPGRLPTFPATVSTAMSLANPATPSPSNLGGATASTPGHPPAALSTAPASPSPSSLATATSSPKRPPISPATLSTALSPASPAAPSLSILAAATASAPGRPLASVSMTLSPAMPSHSSLAAATSVLGHPPAAVSTASSPASPTMPSPSSLATVTSAPRHPPTSPATLSTVLSPTSSAELLPSSLATAGPSAAPLPAAPCHCPLLPGVAFGLSGRQHSPLSWGTWLAARCCLLRLALYAACLLLVALPLLCLGGWLWLGQHAQAAPSASQAAYQKLHAVAAIRPGSPGPGSQGGGRPYLYRTCKRRDVGPLRYISWLLIPLPGPSGQWPWERAGSFGAAQTEYATAVL